MFLCSADAGPFLHPGLMFPRRRAQSRSSMAEGYRRSRRAACLTAASTAPPWDRSGAASCRCSLRRRRGLLQQSAAPLFAQPVAVAADGQHMTVVQQPVEDRARDHRIAKYRTPLAHSQVGGYQHGPALVSAADQLKEQVRCIRLERQIAELINDQ